MLVYETEAVHGSDFGCRVTYLWEGTFVQFKCRSAIVTLLCRSSDTAELELFYNKYYIDKKLRYGPLNNSVIDSVSWIFRISSQ